MQCVARRTGPAESRYGAEAKATTYRAMLKRAWQLLEHGEPVVADATWGDIAWRREAAEVAASTASSFMSFECQAPTDIAAARAECRLRHGTELSEAGGGVARALAFSRAPWPDATPIDTSGPVDQAVSAAVAAMNPAGDRS